MLRKVCAEPQSYRGRSGQAVDVRLEVSIGSVLEEDWTTKRTFESTNYSPNTIAKLQRATFLLVHPINEIQHPGLRITVTGARGARSQSVPAPKCLKGQSPSHRHHLGREGWQRLRFFEHFHSHVIAIVVVVDLPHTRIIYIIYTTSPRGPCRSMQISGKLI